MKMRSNKRRSVSNAEFDKAWANSDNRNIIENVLLRYNQQLSSDERHTCGLHALWRALGYHKEGFGKKFTSNLYQFTHWECRRALREKSTSDRRGNQPLPDEEFMPVMNGLDEEQTGDNIGLLRERMTLLSNEERQLIYQSYLESRTDEEVGQLNGYTKEAARQKINRAFLRLREICVEG
jgi:DNA-directed RNA polymerase specialized sigma24 family protein